MRETLKTRDHQSMIAGAKELNLHILGTEFNYQNLVPVGTGQKKGHVPQKVANCRKPRLLGKF